MVDNKHLQADTLGLGYRRSKRLEDHDVLDGAVPWGTCIRGLDLGDEWLQVGDLYLPMIVRGIQVLQVQAAGTVHLQVHAANGPRTSRFDHMYIGASLEGQHRQTPTVPSSYPVWHTGGHLQFALENFESVLDLEAVALNTAGFTTSLGKTAICMATLPAGQWLRQCAPLHCDASGLGSLQYQLDFAVRWEHSGGASLPAPAAMVAPAEPVAASARAQQVNRAQAGMAHKVPSGPIVYQAPPPVSILPEQTPRFELLPQQRANAAQEPRRLAPVDTGRISEALTAMLRKCKMKLARGGGEAASAAADWLSARGMLVNALQEAEGDFDRLGNDFKELQAELMVAYDWLDDAMSKEGSRAASLLDGVGAENPIGIMAERLAPRASSPSRTPPMHVSRLVRLEPPGGLRSLLASAEVEKAAQPRTSPKRSQMSLQLVDTDGDGHSVSSCGPAAPRRRLPPAGVHLAREAWVAGDDTTSRVSPGVHLVREASPGRFRDHTRDHTRAAVEAARGDHRRARWEEEREHIAEVRWGHKDHFSAPPSSVHNNCSALEDCMARLRRNRNERAQR